MFAEINRAVSLGAKYGLKAVTMYSDASVETPAMDESAMEGAVGIVVTLAAVIIALYITAIVVGSMSKTTTGLAYSSMFENRFNKPVGAFGSFGAEYPRRGIPQSPRSTRTLPVRSHLPVSCR